MNVLKIGGAILFMVIAYTSTAQTKSTVCTDQCCSKDSTQKNTLVKPIKMENKSTKKEITCKLTSPELRKRKVEVIASLKKKVLTRVELSNGYKYKFSGNDAVLDELVTFVKTERLCCDFFNFNLDIAGDGKEVWLTIIGPNGAKEFIDKELEL